MFSASHALSGETIQLNLIRHASVKVTMLPEGKAVHVPDVPINAEGFQQIRSLVAQFYERGQKNFDLVATSPSIRCALTAELLALRMPPLHIWNAKEALQKEQVHKYKAERFSIRCFRKGIDMEEVAEQDVYTASQVSLAAEEVIQEVRLLEMGVSVHDTLEDIWAPKDKWAGKPKQLWEEYGKADMNPVTQMYRLVELQEFLQTLLRTYSGRSIAIVSHQNAIAVLGSLLCTKLVYAPVTGKIAEDIQSLSARYDIERGTCWQFVLERSGNILHEEYTPPKEDASSAYTYAFPVSTGV